jgi:hypothetical protein
MILTQQTFTVITLQAVNPVISAKKRRRKVKANSEPFYTFVASQKDIHNMSR